jgi:acetyl esterase/lipase
VLERRAERGSGLPGEFPKVFIPVGGKDPVMGDSVRLGKVISALGGEARIKIYPGETHAFYAIPLRRAARECWSDIGAFLRS